MPLRPLSFRTVGRKLLAPGFAEVGQTGNHVKFAKRTDRGLRAAVVPRHHEITVGTLHSSPGGTQPGGMGCALTSDASPLASASQELTDH